MRVKWVGDDADEVSMMRNNNGEVQTGVNLGQGQFQTVLNNPDYRYTVFFNQFVPSAFQIFGRMVRK